jgi:predicted DsbA family dithiol-disulfide isomerase
MKVEIYSDIACPWCYIGEHRFKRALAAYPRADQVEVVYRSFQLDPSAPASPVPLLAHLEEKFGARVHEMLGRVGDAAQGEGIAIDWERAQSVNTLTAHRLLRLAEHDYGAEVQRALVEKLFEAYFTRGGNVADPELLTELAAQVGMDRARVQEYLATGEGAEETRYEIDQARRLGISSVPTFVFEERFAVPGAQPASTFLQALEQVAAHLASEGAEDNGDEACADGRCAG